MKKLLLFIAFAVLAAADLRAQVRYLPPTARSWGIGAGIGATVLQGDVEDFNPRLAGRLNLEYNITPYINIGVEGQLGKLAAGDMPSADRYTRVNFRGANANVRFASGQFFRNLNPGSVFGGMYIGAGIGIINSEVTDINEFSHDGSPISGIVKEFTGYTVPLNLGLNLELPRLLGRHNLVANINYQYNFVQGEDLDGYAYKSTANTSFDGFSFLTVGLKYNFGKLK